MPDPQVFTMTDLRVHDGPKRAERLSIQTSFLLGSRAWRTGASRGEACSASACRGRCCGSESRGRSKRTDRLPEIGLAERTSRPAAEANGSSSIRTPISARPRLGHTIASVSLPPECADDRQEQDQLRSKPAGVRRLFLATASTDPGFAAAAAQLTNGIDFAGNGIGSIALELGANVQVTPIPEPTTLLLIGGGVRWIAARRRMLPA